MNYALIENGVVANLLWLHPMNADDFPNAVKIDDLPVRIGDTYADGFFYREGEKVFNMDEQLRAEMADMKAALEMLGVTPDE